MNAWSVMLFAVAYNVESVTAVQEVCGTTVTTL